MNKQLSAFAVILDNSLERGHLTGKLLEICGQSYEAWGYDTYIYDAINIATNWGADEVTFERIAHLRYWIRENVQHGHNVHQENIHTMAQAKEFIDRIIEHEYMYAGDEMRGVEQHDLTLNDKVFQKNSTEQKEITIY